MRPDALLTPRGRLRRLAAHVLGHYALHAPRIAVLSTKEHALLRVDAHVPDHPSPERFALRLYDPQAFHEPSVVTELAWLAALRRDTGLVVPEPVLTRAGERLLKLEVAGHEAPRAAALFRWVDGRRRKASLTPAALASVGRFVAHLHQHAAGFVPRVGQAGQRWDWERVFGNGSPVAPESDDPLLSGEQRRLFDATAARLHVVMKQLGRSPDVWGLIHADLHSSNYLFWGAEVRAIDFEDCGWGYFLYDLAVILDELYAAYAPRAIALRAGLLRGYREVREVTDEQEALLDVFVAMRLAELVRWHGRSDDPAHHAAVPQLLTEAVHHMRQLDLSAS